MKGNIYPGSDLGWNVPADTIDPVSKLVSYLSEKLTGRPLYGPKADYSQEGLA
jgi:hypothetical protein